MNLENVLGDHRAERARARRSNHGFGLDFLDTTEKWVWPTGPAAEEAMHGLLAAGDQALWALICLMGANLPGSDGDH